MDRILIPYFDGKVSLKIALAENGFGLPKYEFILDCAKNGKIRILDEEFQRSFNGYYKIRRDSEWRKVFYQLFADIVTIEDKNNIKFDDILRKLYRKLNKIEFSFASKMLATVNPNKPIWDSQVRDFLGIKTNINSVEIAISVYNELEKAYGDYLKTQNARDNIKLFKNTIPEYDWISDTKIIDFMIWAKAMEKRGKWTG